MLEAKGDRLELGNITMVPSIHGRAAFALEVRRCFLSARYDCVAVELPPSLEEAVTAATELLPVIHAVVYREPGDELVYVPIDPCDSIIEATRLAHRESTCALEFIDAEVGELKVEDVSLPDEYAVLKIGVPAYYLAVAPHLEPPEEEGQDAIREAVMAARLQRLAKKHKRVLFVCGIRHLAGIARMLSKKGSLDLPHPGVPPFEILTRPVHEESLVHVLGELPYNSFLYEQVRHSICLEEYEPIFGLKTLLLAARESYHREFKDSIHRLGVHGLQQMLTYIRNLCLVDGMLTPGLYRIALAAKGVGGDAFAIHLLETAKRYGEMDKRPNARPEDLAEAKEEEEPEPALDLFGFPITPSFDPAAEEESKAPAADDDRIRMTGKQALLDGKVESMKRRLSGIERSWRKLKLRKPATQKMRKEWKRAWDDRRAVSWPPEDDIVERFAGYVRQRALKIAQLGLVRCEEFTSSLMDGLNIRETLRNFHQDKLYVKVEPPATGNVGAVTVIFEDDKEDDRFPWKITWYAEHDNESTLAFYATPFQEDIVGPGVARSLYGGAMFLFPPQSIPNVWDDPRLDKARNSMERLLFAAALHSEDKFIAYVAPERPTARMRMFCQNLGKRVIFLPLSSFSRSTLWKLRTFHVLNGRHVRSYAAKFIR